MADDSFRLPVSSYDELTKIIQAYNVAGSDSSLDDVANTAAMNRTTVSANNGFLKGTGVIKGGNKKSITEKGSRLALALDHGIDDEIRRSWNDIVEDDEFLQKILAAVRIRGGMDSETLQSHIAYTAGQAKGQRTATGANAIIDILQISQLLEDQDGKLVAVKNAADRSHEAKPSEDSKQEPPSDDSKPEVVNRSVAMAQPGAVIPMGGTQVGVSVQIQIQCGIEEIDQLGEKLPVLLEALARAGENAKNEPDDEV